MTTVAEPRKAQVILLAAGLSSRFKDKDKDYPDSTQTSAARPTAAATIIGGKLWQPLLGKPVIGYSIDVFLNWPHTRCLIIVAPKESETKILEYIAKEYPHTQQSSADFTARDRAAPTIFALGGKKPAPIFSLRLQHLEWNHREDDVIVHDAARPLIHAPLLDYFRNSFHERSSPLLSLAKTMPATVATQSQKKTPLLQEIIPKENLVQLETPQAIRIKTLEPFLHTKHTKHAKYAKHTPSSFEIVSDLGADFPDLISWGLKLGLQAESTCYPFPNTKITFAEDLQWAEAWLLHGATAT